MYKLLKKDFEEVCINLPFDLKGLHKKSFFVTGASGLIGSYFIYFLDYLNREYDLAIKITALSRSKCKLEESFKGLDVEILEQDLNEKFVFDINADYVIHAASNAHPLAYSKDPVGTMKTNLLGTMNLLESIRKTDTKFLYISSGEVYGSNVDHAFTEDDLGVVDTKTMRACYPESKRAAETLCMAYNSQLGVNVNIARLCYIYGPTITETNSRADAQFLRNVLKGEDIVMKSLGEQRRTYCYVADVVSALLTILLKGSNGHFYNIANPSSIVSVKEYAENLCSLAGVNLRFVIPDEVEKRGYSKAQDSILDATKLLTLGWKPLFDIKEGLKRTIEVKKEG